MYNFALLSTMIYHVYLQNTAQHNLPNNQDDTSRLKNGKTKQVSYNMLSLCGGVCILAHTPNLTDHLNHTILLML